MKLKYLLTTAICLVGLTFPVAVNAASFSVRLGQPKSPTNQNYLKLTYVALDTEDRQITVKCFKKGPSDAGFSQFDVSKTMIPGGNTDTCLVDSNVLNSQGTYDFYVEGIVGSEVVQSSTVSLKYNTEGPWAPGEYSKEKINNCDYRIKFKTSADGGRTIKVQLFRSDNLAITVDGGNVVATQNIGSDTNGEFVNSVPNCDKNYYFAIRSVDSSDNVSGIVGDSFTTSVSSSSTTTDGSKLSGVSGGAILVDGKSQVLDGSLVGQSVKNGEEVSPTPVNTEVTITPESTPQVLGISTTKRNMLLLIAIPVALIAGYFLLNSKKKAK